jgi:hypothetical protein
MRTITQPGDGCQKGDAGTLDRSDSSIEGEFGAHEEPLGVVSVSKLVTSVARGNERHSAAFVVSRTRQMSPVASFALITTPADAVSPARMIRSPLLTRDSGVCQMISRRDDSAMEMTTRVPERRHDTPGETEALPGETEARGCHRHCRFGSSIYEPPLRRRGKSRL